MKRWLVVCAVGLLATLSVPALVLADPGPPAPIPVPPAIILGAVGIGIVGAVQLYRRRRRK